jgi:lysyl-tRNA synthetase class 2
MVEKIEPHLADLGPVIVKDYPVERAAFSTIRHDPHPVAERWELYINGLELANAYTELTDPAEQRRRMENTNKNREMEGRPSLPLDEHFLRVLKNMPDCAGIALGSDRLLMALLQIGQITDVLLFPGEQISDGSPSRQR